MISRTISIHRAFFHISPVLLMALLLGGCSDRILPADNSANIWGKQKILFTQEGSDQINTISLDAETPDQPPIASGFLLSPPSAGRFIYSTDPSGSQRTIYLHDKTGTIPLVAPQQGEYLDDIAAISPDGGRVVYVTTDNNNGDVYLNMIRTDGSGPVRLAWYFGTITGMIFSPDNRHVGISAGEGFDPEVLYIYDLDGDSVVTVLDQRDADLSLIVPPLHPNDPLSIYWFQWMPDGKRVIYQDVDAVGRRWIMTAPIDGGYTRAVVEGNYTFPTPSPDGKLIAAIRDGNQLWVMNTNGSGERRLISSNIGGINYLLFPQWSSDGSKILLYRVTFSSQSGTLTFGTVMQVVDVATGRHKALLPNTIPGSWLE